LDPVRDRFTADHVVGMDKFPTRFMILLLDFDSNANRLEDVRAVIPDQLRDRVFVIGAWSEPEALRQAGLGSCETIGKALAADCRDGTDRTWGMSFCGKIPANLSGCGSNYVQFSSRMSKASMC
jgi:hypothetical protein